MTTVTTPQSQALWMLNGLTLERVTADQTNYAVVDDTAHVYVIASSGVPAVVSTAARYGISILPPPA